MAARTGSQARTCVVCRGGGSHGIPGAGEAREAEDLMGRGKSQRNLKLIDAAYAILEEIHPATVRAVCYRLFALGHIESMAKTCTNRVSSQLTWAREEGTIPWGWIVDETREAEYRGGWENPEEFIEAAQRSYRRDRWATQPRRAEVWSEKGTVRGTLAPVLEEYQVTFRVMHGFASSTALHEVAEHRDPARPLVVLYAGDWDPSGLYMSELDVPKRLLGFIHSKEWLKRWEDLNGPLQSNHLTAVLDFDAKIDLRRVALTEDDVAGNGLPSFPADIKRGDTRYGWFRKTYGRRCWELDALSPVVLRARVEGAIREQIDRPAWERAELGEAAEQAALATVLGKWHQSISRQATK